jgi:hypothetical protein
MNWLEWQIRGGWLGMHFAANIFVAAALPGLFLRQAADRNPIWAISSLIAASDPLVQQAVKVCRRLSTDERQRMINQ